MLKGAVSAFDTELAAVPRSFTHSQACRKSGDFRYKTFELPWPRTWTEKLADSKDLPKVVKLTGAAAKKWGCKTLAIAASSEIDTLMRQVSRGKVTTTQELRAAVAQMHAAEQGLPTDHRDIQLDRGARRRGTTGCGEGPGDAILAHAQSGRRVEPQISRRRRTAKGVPHSRRASGGRKRKKIPCPRFLTSVISPISRHFGPLTT